MYVCMIVSPREEPSPQQVHDPPLAVPQKQTWFNLPCGWNVVHESLDFLPIEKELCPGFLVVCEGRSGCDYSRTHPD